MLGDPIDKDVGEEGPEEGNQPALSNKPRITEEQMRAIDAQLKDKLIIKKREEKTQIFKVRSGLLTQNQRKHQKDLEKKWVDGQELDANGILPSEKTVVSFTQNYEDLKEDVHLLSLSAKLPERRREQMEKRSDLIAVLGKYLEKIPEGKAVYYLVSSGSPAENESIPAAIDPAFFDDIIKKIQHDSPPEEEISAWKNGQNQQAPFPGRKFLITSRTADRCHVTLLEGKEGFPTAIQFEIACLKLDDKIVFQSSKYFEDEKFRKFGTPDEAGKKLEKVSNEWIKEQGPHLREYEQFYQEILDLPLPDWEKELMQKTTEALFFILKSGNTKFSEPREVRKGEFMNNREDALVMVRDFKFNTYGKAVFREPLLKMKKLAEAKNLQRVSSGLDFLLTEDIL